jgi:hypothetical protein
MRIEKLAKVQQRCEINKNLTFLWLNLELDVVTNTMTKAVNAIKFLRERNCWMVNVIIIDDLIDRGGDLLKKRIVDEFRETGKR